MSIVQVLEKEWKKGQPTDTFLTNAEKEKAEPSVYQPKDEEKAALMMVVEAFRWSDLTLRKPRREYNDMSTLTRMMYDQMAFNIYQPNNGQPYYGDTTQSWKSNAMRPIIRNKVISIAAHATAKLLFPKVFATNEQSEEQENAAHVMRDLIEWASNQNDYDTKTLYAVINACVNPASIMHLEYAEAYRTIKTEKDDKGKWKTEEILDESNSGFQLTPVPVDELFIADFYQENIQKQEYLIWRRVQTFATMKAKYSHYDNFKYVKPGVQIIYNDANVSFFEVYDSNLRSELCEEIIFYSKTLDLQLVVVNGILITEPDNPNPRMDKNYPFIKFYYEPFDEGRCFYGKSLAFKMQPDADIINTLYPMIIDGTYLNIFNPLLVSGEEEIGADVMIPGAVTTLINPESSVTPLRVGQDMRQGMETLQKVEESINDSSQAEMNIGTRSTAYQISTIQAEQQTLMGLFVKMMASYVRQYGELIKSDIIQYITIPEVDKIIDNGELIYKTIMVHDKLTDKGKVNRSIKFDGKLPDNKISEDKELDMSYDILSEQGGKDSKQEIYKVNPKLFRDLKFKVTISPDVMNPMSDDLERAFGLEVFDKALQAPAVGVPLDMEQIFKDFLFKLYPKSAENVDKYFKKETLGVPEIPGMPPINLNPNAAGGQNPTPAQGANQAGVTTGPGLPNVKGIATGAKNILMGK